MRAVICQNAQMSVGELPEAVPAQGQSLVKVLRCGICGSDLHMRHHCDHMSQLYNRMGYPNHLRSDQPLVFGHEFCGEVLEHGPGTASKIRPGTRVCVLPVIRKGSEIDMIGLSSRSPGAYAERVLAEESMLMPIPNGLPDDLAALTEPMAVGWHAVRRSEIKTRDVAIVIGCGPVGLAVVAMLKAKGVKTVIACDFSPGRRTLAQQCGADILIDPAQQSPYSNWQEFGFVNGLADLLELAVSTREKLGKLPVPWWHTWRLAEALGALPPRPIVFECVGVPGVLQNIMAGAPSFSRVVVVGLCMEADKIDPAVGILKEIEVRFVLGYSPLEYRDTLHMIAEGKVNCAPLITGVVGLDGVAGAFDALKNPEAHAKILIDPGSSKTLA